MILITPLSCRMGRRVSGGFNSAPLLFGRVVRLLRLGISGWSMGSAYKR